VGTSGIDADKSRLWCAAMRRLTSCFHEITELGWLTDVLKAFVSLLSASGRFTAFGPEVQVLETRYNRVWRTLLSRQKGGCAGNYTGVARIAGSERNGNHPNFLPDARAARRVPDIRAACFAMLT
jgi:hypothetical protein